MTLPDAAESGSSPRKLWVIATCIACVLVGLALGHMVTYHWMSHNSAGFRTPYQAVLLSNGAVYYGKLSGYGTRYPVLTDVFYIVRKTDPESKQVTNILVKRGKELHGPRSHVLECKPSVPSHAAVTYVLAETRPGTVSTEMRRRLLCLHGGAPSVRAWKAL